MNEDLKRIIRPIIRPFWGHIRPYYSRIVNFKRYKESRLQAIPFEKELREEIKTKGIEAIIIFESFFGFNMKMFQRPQHIALNLADEKVLYFYKASPYIDKDITSYKKLKDGFYIVNTDLFWVHESILKIAKESGLPKFAHIYSTTFIEYDKYLKNYYKKGFKILYEFVDDFSDKIAGYKIPKKVYQSHDRMMEDTDKVYVVSTANKLFEKVKKVRGTRNSILATNGVQFEHFSVPPENVVLIPEMVNILAKGNKIIGYFGALAEWFDYELLKKLAIERPDKEIVLIGVDYDKSIEKSGIEKLLNIHFLGPINYTELPAYSKYFDVCIIPFILNDITESTSPVKLFEYMAMGHPIVTSDLPECRKYKSTLISKTPEAFLANIDKALELTNNDEYREILRSEAQANTWSKKAKAIKELILNGSN